MSNESLISKLDLTERNQKENLVYQQKVENDSQLKMENRIQNNLIFKSSSQNDSFLNGLEELVVRMNNSSVLGGIINCKKTPEYLLELIFIDKSKSYFNYYRTIRFFSKDGIKLTYESVYESQHTGGYTRLKVDHYASIKAGEKVYDRSDWGLESPNKVIYTLSYSLNQQNNYKEVYEVILSWISFKREDLTIQNNRDTYHFSNLFGAVFGFSLMIFVIIIGLTILIGLINYFVVQHFYDAVTAPTYYWSKVFFFISTIILLLISLNDIVKLFNYSSTRK